MKNILVLGATSSIAEHTLRRFAVRHCRLYLVARNERKLHALAEDLRIRGAVEVVTIAEDLNAIERHQNIMDSAKDSMVQIDLLFIAYGSLPKQDSCVQSSALTITELKTNCLSVLSFLTIAANMFQQQRSGSIAVISSVAGDRGRQSNYVYGAAKGAVSIFLQGLRNRMHGYGVHVLTIKPGFVDTPMTRDFDKGILWVGPDTIARGIVDAIDKRKEVVYLPSFWRYVMIIIKLIPESVFKRLSL